MITILLLLDEYKEDHGIRPRSLKVCSCANKMITFLLFLAEYKEDRGIGPHSLKVTTIPTLMEAIAKGKENLSHLATKCNYRAVTAHDMGKVYSRNPAQRKIFVSKSALKASEENQAAETLITDLPEFSGKTQGGNKSLNAEILGKYRPTGRSMS